MGTVASVLIFTCFLPLCDADEIRLQLKSKSRLPCPSSSCGKSRRPPAQVGAGWPGPALLSAGQRCSLKVKSRELPDPSVHVLRGAPPPTGPSFTLTGRSRPLESRVASVTIFWKRCEQPGAVLCGSESAAVAADCG